MFLYSDVEKKKTKNKKYLTVGNKRDMRDRRNRFSNSDRSSTSNILHEVYMEDSLQNDLTAI